MEQRRLQTWIAGALAAGLGLSAVPAQAKLTDFVTRDFLKVKLPTLPLPLPLLDKLNVQAVHGVRPLYLGAGFTNELIHTYAEVPTRYGNPYVKIGRFLQGPSTAWQVGYRYPFSITEGEGRNGYYVGGLVGDVENDSYAGQRYNRLGIGAELSYLMMDLRRSNAFSLALAFGEPQSKAGYAKKRTEPFLLFGYSLGFGAF